MKERFEGSNRLQLVEALRRQELIAGDVTIAQAFADAGELIEYPKGHAIITQDAHDNDIFFLLTGSTAVVVKGNQVAIRKAGQHIGEMAALEPAQPRSATIVAHDTVVVLKVPNADFVRLGTTYPQIWLSIARELSRRLLERNKLIPVPNEQPKLFIISSTEALPVAREVQAHLHRDVFSTLWNQGVFFAGGYSLEAIEKVVGESDFAVAIAQTDDIIDTRGSRYPTLRDNVLFELGLFMGKLTRYRTILLHPRVPDLKLPSDLQGLSLLAYEHGAPKDLPVLLGPACNEIRKIVFSLGIRKLTA
jgi:CRP/FNR family cyclic AMP-dependent transcriptional regulator